MSDAKREEAARLLAGNLSKAEVARQVEVDRATITRWAKDPEFLQAVEGYKTGDDDEQSLESLVPDAYRLLKSAMQGGNVPATKARVALDILSRVSALDRESKKGESSFEAKLAQLQADGKLDDSD